MFAGDECYANHYRPNKQGQSVCQKFYKCTKCQKIMSYKRRRPEDQMCGEVHCLNCEDFVDPNTHRCYMKPIVIEEMKTKNNKNNKGKRRKQRENEDVFQRG